MKMRPEFKIVDWRILGGAPQQLAPPTDPTKLIGGAVAPLTTAEIIDDDFPENLGGASRKTA